MHLFDILAILLSLAAVFSWINHRFIRLPTSIGLMLIALLLSLGLLISPLDSEWQATLKQLLEDIDFEDTVLHGMLGFLLFAGAPESLNTKITGESLFNDGVAVVLFLTLIGIATGEREPSPFGALGMLGYEVIGGALPGILSGGLVLLMLSRADDYQVEILLTLALATGGDARAAGADHRPARRP
ncbi:cation:proton antiporter [Allochromatium tepidum]|uniref:Cation/H+ exchanger transmembrane domain-containing protein n=1 Tax=Allochromatium tepidum TaxID=553982 RepID=A0ABM7QK15_9GAMM|nr:cation:proton antiporter [Allochromatium tepidum]BCU06110.1 hypothetical protein Atep_07870 [Allochromatium tepidum]